ncbi:MAG TPA: alpha-amylase [Candidatus Limnocylindria bacterium]|nr:alpha-amylase [Candidatus Limnocylindria bacterium]
MFQAFEWHLPNDGGHWDRIAELAPHLKHLGVGGVWLPPCCKARDTGDAGYGIYDLWDAGEFDQKGAVRTKYGTRAQLEVTIHALHEQGIQAYADMVLNHKAGADEAEVFQAVKVNPENRLEDISEPHDIRGWTRFTFPGRQGQYSGFAWNFQHFTGVDHDDLSGEDGVFLIVGQDKGFSPRVHDEKGNFDYLMYADVDYRNKDVIAETVAWGEWFLKTLGFDGMRLDAVKHISSAFVSMFVREMRLRTGKPLYAVAEYWLGDDERLLEYIGETRDQMALFDVGLHFNFADAAAKGREYDLRTVFDGSLLSRNAYNVATFVDNHDSQPGQSLESWVDAWFKPLAYALILLRRDGYPCLFWGDYFGVGGPWPQPALQGALDPLLLARKEAAYGEQVDYFDHPNCVGWVRLGDAGYPGSGLVVLMSNGDDGRKRMGMGELNGGTAWRDVTGNIQDAVTLDEKGEAEFMCRGGSVSVYRRA